jgi:hypothetical protein
MTAAGTSAASAALRVKLELVAPALRAAAAGLWRVEPPEPSRRRYLAYLHEMHALIRASVPLMERAASRCAVLAPCEPVAGALGRYLERHIEQERDHDTWLLEDIAAAGGDPTRTVRRPSSPDIADLAGAQYYWIEHQHPIALLGYIRTLEGNAPAPGLADRLADRTGLPDAAFHTVRAHAELDHGHLAELDETIDALPLTPAHETALAVSALHTADGLIRLFTRLATATTEGGPE